MRLGFEQVGVEQTEREGVGLERYLMRRVPESHDIDSASSGGQS